MSSAIFTLLLSQERRIRSLVPGQERHGCTTANIGLSLRPTIISIEYVSQIGDMLPLMLVGATHDKGLISVGGYNVGEGTTT